MGLREVGLILLWLGTILLVAVLQHRLRKGALSEAAFEQSPPLERWQVPVAVAGTALAAFGGGLAVWGWVS